MKTSMKQSILICLMLAGIGVGMGPHAHAQDLGQSYPTLPGGITSWIWQQAFDTATGPVSQIPQITCFEAALAGPNPLPWGDARQMCAGAATNAPLECYQYAHQIHVYAALCVGATSAQGPIECYQKATAAPFSLVPPEAAVLCTGADNNQLQCYGQALGAPYRLDKYSALDLCGSQSSFLGVQY